MKTQIRTNVSAFVGDLRRPERSVSNSGELFLGKTFINNKEIMQIISVLSGKHSNGKTVNINDVETNNPISGFYIFTLLFHQYFNDCFGKMDAEFEKKIDALQTALIIDSEDRIQLTEFFLNQEAFTDKKNAVYFTNNRKTNSTKYLGANVMYAANRNNEVVYLKYFKNFDLFLSKTFVKCKNPYHFIEETLNMELNIIHASNYFMDDFGYNTFDEVVNSVRSHQPYQYFELAATANTPKIVLDPIDGKVIISGSSSPFSPTNFFTPILEWFDNHRKLGDKPLEIYIILDYFNTYTSKFLVQLCRKCDAMAKEGKGPKIFWYFDPEDTDMREFGEHLGGIYKKGFEYCIISDGVEELV
ncbi:DUF1987 domain-containing protein [Aurantibacillus circumpalustris]|uniref:DUF1987 domain-containing protein n=1 Tax=Aurantibacillus circumpalustris TaxID=3036359 RepID=UPI00295B7F9A|nr:DUF1987 domain-containing protein [Aurantibacillus circumpalustris]